jgi:PHD/YefM family antitoxin component YafN of YafNO toxin-antitoxin module
MDSMSNQMQANRKRIEKNSDKIMERRASIIRNAGDITKNQQRIAKKISS